MISESGPTQRVKLCTHVCTLVTQPLISIHCLIYSRIFTRTAVNVQMVIYAVHDIQFQLSALELSHHMYGIRTEIGIWNPHKTYFIDSSTTVQLHNVGSK